MNKLTKEDLRFIDPIRNAIPIEFTWTPKMEILNPIRVQSRKVALERILSGLGEQTGADKGRPAKSK